MKSVILLLFLLLVCAMNVICAPIQKRDVDGVDLVMGMGVTALILWGASVAADLTRMFIQGAINTHTYRQAIDYYFEQKKKAELEGVQVDIQQVDKKEMDHRPDLQMR